MEDETAWSELTDEETIDNWANRKYAISNRERNKDYLRSYLKAIGLGAKEALDEKRKHRDSRIVEMKLLKFYDDYQAGGKSEASAYNMAKTVRSFYKFYGQPLMIQKGDLPSRIGKKKLDFELTLDHIKAICHAAGTRGRALILTAESLGWREGDIAGLKRIQVEPYLNEEPPIMVKLVTQKEKVKAKGFLHKAAVEAIREYLATRDDDCPFLFITKIGKPKGLYVKELNRIFKTFFHRAGYKEGDRRIRFHCLRKFWVGRMQDAGVSTEIWKQLIGRATGTEEYDSTRLREAFIKAMPKLDPSQLVNNHGKVISLEAKVIELERKLATLERVKTAEQLAKYFAIELPQARRDTQAYIANQPKKILPAGLSIEEPRVFITQEDLVQILALARAMRKAYEEKNSHS